MVGVSSLISRVIRYSSLITVCGHVRDEASGTPIIGLLKEVMVEIRGLFLMNVTSGKVVGTARL